MLRKFHNRLAPAVMKSPLGRRHISPVLGLLAIAALATGCAENRTDSAKGPADPANLIETTTRTTAQVAESSFDYTTAATAWGSLYQRHPDDADLALRLARNLRYSGQVQGAIDVCSNFADRHGPSPALQIELGKDYLAADRLALAVRTLQQAAGMAPRDWDVQSALGVALDYQGNYDGARQSYEQALALSPDNPVVLNNLGLSQAEAGHLADAEATLSKAVEQPKATAQVRQNLALIKALKGDLTGAERLSRQDLPPDMARANGAYYRLLAGASRLP